jgi:hypothetical protein
MPVRRTGAPQDDSREQDMLRVFGLRQISESSRGDNDAFLDLDGMETQAFELKSSTTSNLVTARDFSLEHIKEWRTKHVLGSFYDKGGNAILWSLLIPNLFLNEWLDEQVEYIRCDVEIIEVLSSEVTSEMAQKVIRSIFGERESFTEEDLKKVLKRQITSGEYSQYLSSGPNAEKLCSLDSMEKAIRSRTQYLLNRGTSRNNPHISDGWIKRIIERDSRLRLDHPPGDYQRPKSWLEQLIREYAVREEHS